MKVCIVGAGAIGGFIATRLAASGQAEVSAIARGATLAALRKKGWRLQMGEQILEAPACATDNAADLGVQDVVVLAVKSPALSAAVQAMKPLLGPETIVLPAMNGVPWWFCQPLPAFANISLRSVDPSSSIASSIRLEQVVGCVVHASTSTPEPGLVQHKMGQGLIIGEPVGGTSSRVARLADLLTRAGFDVTQSPNIRYDIWYKLWGNMTMNPVSALTGATADLILDDPLVRGFCAAAMTEAAAVGAKLGCTIDQSPEDRNVITSKLGAFKTSMLQDVEAGKSIELDAIVGVVRELAQHVGVPTPNIDALYGLTRLFGQTHGIYRPGTPA